MLLFYIKESKQSKYYIFEKHALEQEKMPNLEKLNRLINNLSRNEKRYFKQYANIYSPKKEQDYLILFDIISQQKEFNLEKIKIVISEKNIANISIKSKYLYNSILESLSNFNKKHYLNTKLNDKIFQATLLTDRGLIVEALELIKFVKKKAKKLEDFDLLNHALKKEREIIYIKNYGRSSEEYIEVNKGLKKYQLIIRNIDDYEDISSKIHKSTTKPNSSLSLQEIQEKYPLLKDETQALSTKALGLHYHIKGMVYYILQDYEAMLAVMTKAINLIPNANFSPRRILGFYQNYFVVAKILKSSEAFEYGMEKYEKINFKKKQYKAMQMHFYIVFLSEYILLTQSKKQINTDKLYASYEKDYQDYQFYTHWHRQKLWLYDIIALSIEIENFEQANIWLNRLLECPEIKELNNEEQVLLKFIKIILHYENKVNSLIESENRAIVYFVKKRELDNPIILLGTDLFQLLSKKNAPEQEVELFKQYAKKIESMNDSIKNSLWKFTFLKLWLKAKTR